jgi:hypothetical protein
MQHIQNLTLLWYSNKTLQKYFVQADSGIMIALMLPVPRTEVPRLQPEESNHFIPLQQGTEKCKVMTQSAINISVHIRML